jgi:hypothetical protein
LAFSCFVFWSNFRSYAITNTSVNWLKQKILPKFKQSDEWEPEANSVESHVIPQLVGYLNDSVRFALPILAAFSLNVGMVALSSLGSFPPEWLTVISSLINAGMFVLMVIQHQRLCITNSYVVAYHIMATAVDMYNSEQNSVD